GSVERDAAAGAKVRGRGTSAVQEGGLDAAWTCGGGTGGDPAGAQRSAKGQTRGGVCSGAAWAGANGGGGKAAGAWRSAGEDRCVEEGACRGTFGCDGDAGRARTANDGTEPGGGEVGTGGGEEGYGIGGAIRGGGDLRCGD